MATNKGENASLPPAPLPAGENVYYVVRLSGNGSVCVVNGNQIHPVIDGGDLVIGSPCQVGDDRNTQTAAVILGIGSESAISVLENCLKHSETSSTGDVTVVATNNQQSSSSLTNETSFQGSGIDGVSTSRSSSSDGVKNVWSSELAALLSPISKSSPNVTKGKSGQKRSTVAMETPIPKKRKIDSKAPSSVVRPPTVVPAKPVGSSHPSISQPISSSRTQVNVGSEVSGGTSDDKTQRKGISNEIDSTSLQSEKTDAMSQILHELKEMRRWYSTLAGSFLIIRRNQDDIKNRLAEIGLSILTNSSEPLIMTSDPTTSKIAGITSSIDHHDNSPMSDSVTATGGVENVDIIPGDPDHPHTLQGIDLRATFPEFDPDYLVVSRGKSCSRRNFAVNLVRYLFTPEEMSCSNCSGTRGKNRLDQGRLAIVRRATLTLWAVKENMDIKTEWAKCIYSIDEACRRLNRPRVKKKDSHHRDEIITEDDSPLTETEVHSFIENNSSQL